MGEVRRTGVFGGTFDPPHLGHVGAALDIRRELKLDRVLFVVANQPWQKIDDRPVSPAADRLALVRAATSGVEGLEASDLEIERGGPTYTVDTLDELSRRFPHDELFVIVGRDAAEGLDTWERSEELSGRATFVLIDRPGAGSSRLPDGFTWLEVESVGLDISSTDVRDLAASEGDIGALVPARVATCIAERGLYRGDHDE